MKILLNIACILAVALPSTALAAQSRGSFNVGLTIVPPLPELPDFKGQPRPEGWNPREAPDNMPVSVNDFEVEGWVDFNDASRQAVVVLKDGRVIAQHAIQPGADFNRLAYCEDAMGRTAVAVVQDAHDPMGHDIAVPDPIRAWWVSKDGTLEPVRKLEGVRCGARVDPGASGY